MQEQKGNKDVIIKCEACGLEICATRGLCENYKLRLTRNGKTADGLTSGGDVKSMTDIFRVGQIQRVVPDKCDPVTLARTVKARLGKHERESK
jgi:hypothetical protein